MRVFLMMGRWVGAKVDLSKDYWLQVFEPSLDSWAQGTTPNPDVLCNKYAPYPLIAFLRFVECFGLTRS